MDKQKEIEEIANIIADCRFTDPKSEAIDLYNAKCRILPEDSVVITREEYEKFLKVNSELAVSQKSISFLSSELNDYKQRYESVEKRYEQLVQSSCEALEKGKAQARKETAREILKSMFDGEIGGKYDCKVISIEKFNELAKQYGVEIGEENV